MADSQRILHALKQRVNGTTAYTNKFDSASHTWQPNGVA